MGYWIPFPAFGLDRRFDRCASVVFEREGRLYYFRLYLFVRTCTRAESSEFTNCDTVSFSSSKNPRLRNLDHHTLTPFCKIFTSRYRIVRSRSRNTMDYFVREKESINACTHVVHKRMGISSRNGASSWNKRAKIFSICARFEQSLLFLISN